jgi:hypothetical protein
MVVEKSSKIFLIKMEDEKGKVDWKATPFEKDILPVYIDLISQREGIVLDEAEIDVKASFLRAARIALRTGKYTFESETLKDEVPRVVNDINEALDCVIPDQVHKYGGRAFVLGFVLSYLSKGTGDVGGSVAAIGPNGETTTYMRFGSFREKKKLE